MSRKSYLLNDEGIAELEDDLLECDNVRYIQFKESTGSCDIDKLDKLQLYKYVITKVSVVSTSSEQSASIMYILLKLIPSMPFIEILSFNLKGRYAPHAFRHLTTLKNLKRIAWYGNLPVSPSFHINTFKCVGTNKIKFPISTNHLICKGCDTTTQTFTTGAIEKISITADDTCACELSIYLNNECKVLEVCLCQSLKCTCPCYASFINPTIEVLVLSSDLSIVTNGLTQTDIERIVHKLPNLKKIILNDIYIIDVDKATFNSLEIISNCKEYIGH